MPEAAKLISGRMAHRRLRQQAVQTAARRVLRAIVAACSSPGYFIFALLSIVAWSSYHHWARVHQQQHPILDGTPQDVLQALLSLNALLLTVAVLMWQNPGRSKRRGHGSAESGGRRMPDRIRRARAGRRDRYSHRVNRRPTTVENGMGMGVTLMPKVRRATSESSATARRRLTAAINHVGR